MAIIFKLSTAFHIAFYIIIIATIVASCDPKYTLSKHQNSYTFENTEDYILEGEIESYYGNEKIENVQITLVAINQVYPEYKDIRTCEDVVKFIDNIPERYDWTIYKQALTSLEEQTSTKNGKYKLYIKAEHIEATSFHGSLGTPPYAFLVIVFKKDGYKSVGLPFTPNCESFIHNLQIVKLKKI